jgi:hypothetical protein
MADNVVVKAGTAGSDITVSTDDAGASGHVQRVKLCLSADGSASHVTADAGGLLVNLGANNDVTVTGGPVAVTDNAGSLTVDAPVGTPLNVQIGDAANTATIRNLAANDALNVAIVDGAGAHVTSFGGTGGTAMTDDATFTPGTTVFTPTGGTYRTARYAVNDNDGGAFAMTATRAQLVCMETPAGDSAMDEANNAVNVSIVSDALAVTEYTEGNTDSSISGMAVMWEDDADTLRAVSVAKPMPTFQAAFARGGCAIHRTLDLDESEEEVKGTAGVLYGWAITNRATTTRYVKIYNATAASVTVGVTTPVITWGIPGNSTDHVGANMLGGVGIGFSTAICVACTTGFADADASAPGTNDLIANFFYL